MGSVSAWPSGATPPMAKPVAWRTRSASARFGAAGNPSARPSASRSQCRSPATSAMTARFSPFRPSEANASDFTMAPTSQPSASAACCAVRTASPRAITRSSAPKGASAARTRLTPAWSSSGLVFTSLMPASRNLEAALHRRSRHQRIVPALHVGIVVQVDLVPFMARRPGQGRHVCDRVFPAGEILVLRQMAVEHLVEALRLGGETLDGVGHLLLGETHEVVRLAEHRAEAAHLPHQPLQRLHARTGIGGQELAALLGEIDQDRTGLEDAVGLLAVGRQRLVIDDGGNLVVRIHLEEIGRELLVL